MQSHPIPAVDVIDSDNQRVTIELGTARDTVADLAAALGHGPGAGLEIGGAAAPPTCPLVDVESLVEGARVAPVAASSPRENGSTGEPSDFEFAVVAGPSCRAWTPLVSGRHGVGRSPALSVHLDDPRAELHHALLVADRTVTIVQLTGRTPIEIVTHDGAEPVTDHLGRKEIRPGDVVTIGASRLVVRVARNRRPDEGDDDATGAVGDELHASTIGPIVGDPWHRELRRGPIPHHALADTAICVPSPSAMDAYPAPTALVGAGVAAAGAVGLAAVLGQTMFAIIALVGAVASFATWLVGVVGVWRRHRRAHRADRTASEQFERQLVERHRRVRACWRATDPDVVDMLTDVAAERRWVWRRRADRDGIRVALGPGTVIVPPTLEPDGSVSGEPRPSHLATVDHWSRFADVAVPLVIRPSEALAVTGAHHAVRALLRSIAVQIASSTGPADVRIVVVTDDVAGWEWATWLPHVRDALGEPLLFGTDDLERLTGAVVPGEVSDERRVVLIVDAPAALTVRTGPLRRFIGADPVSTIVGCATGVAVPSVCRRVLTIGSAGRATWTGPSLAGEPMIDHLLIAGIDEAQARAVALALAALVDPEDDAVVGAGLPRAVAFSALEPDVFTATPPGIVERWHSGGPDPAPAVAVGMSSDGVVELDLARDGPHVLIAGTTGSGKSELLRTIVIGLAARLPPSHLQFVFVDYKGGATFDGCAALPHTAGVVTDLDGGLAERALASLDAELSRRERLFRDLGVADLREYRAAHARDPVSRLVVMIDEFATMAHDVPGFLSALVGIAQRGRSLGVHLVLATQRPAGVVNDDIRANTNLRLALRVNDRADGIDVIGDDLPATFPRQLPGRCAVRLGHDELVVFQAASTAGPRPEGRRGLSVRRSPRLFDAGRRAGATVAEHAVPGGSASDELSTLVGLIREAAVLSGAAVARGVWLEPLPSVVDAGQVSAWIADAGAAHDAIGLIDDPAEQRRRPLRWDVASGNLLLVGAIGAGVTSTIVSLACAVCRTSGPEDLHLYVIDGYGDRSLDSLTQIAHCGGVIRVGDVERIDRLLGRLDAEIDRRASGGSAVDARADPAVLLFVDGIGALRRSLDGIDRLAVLAMLDRILDAGPAVGITTCCSTDGTVAGSPVPVADRWVFRVDEQAAAQLGVRSVPGELPPGRLRIASSGLAAQVAVGADGLAALAERTVGVGPPAVDVLPVCIDPADLRASHRRSAPGRSVRRLAVGCGADDLDTAFLEVAAGDHIFIGGAGRTGTSTVLAQVAAAWCELEGDGSVVEWPLPAAWPEVAMTGWDGAREHRLLVVDDADRVDDTAGVIEAILQRRAGPVTIAAAGRLEAVRAAYGHWTREIARSRCGVIMTAPGEVDGDLLGVLLPRRTPIPARPGLGWIVDGQGHRLVQFAGRLRA